MAPGRDKIWGRRPGVGAGWTLHAVTAPPQLSTTPRTKHIPDKPFPRKACWESTLCAVELSWILWERQQPQVSEGLRGILSRTEALPRRADLQQQKPFPGTAERNPRHGWKKSRWQMRNGCTWYPQDGLAGTGWGQPCAWEQPAWDLLAQGCAAASEPGPCQCHRAGRDQDRGTDSAVVQPALLRLSWVYKGEQGSSVLSVTAWLADV